MTITTRLSVFFLVTLAVVLAGFSLTLYILAHIYLHRQMDVRVEAALNTLAAAAEVGADGIEWEPHQRQLVVSQPFDRDVLYWLVQDGQGNRVDSALVHADHHLVAFLAASPEPSGEVLDGSGNAWLLSRRCLAASRDSHSRPGPLPESPDADKKYSVLVITAAAALAPVQSVLRNLAATLGGSSVVLWLIAAFVGRRLCRRALLPVSQIAATARDLNVATLDQRLPVQASGDEVEVLSRSINELLARLQESFERQRRFTGDASHELRTPLTAMLGQVEVALLHERDPEEYRRVLTLVQRRLGQLRQIVEMLLFLARAETEASIPSREVIDLTAWLPEHLQSRCEDPRAADCTLHQEAMGPLRVEVHTPLLSQLVDNLLDNACKYSEPGSAITLRLRSEASRVVLIVEDRGFGVGPEDLPYIFEPFYRSAGARRTSQAGVGLGLAVARRIARALHGSLDVESKVGKGSSFTVRFPSATVPGSAVEHRSLAEHGP